MALSRRKKNADRQRKFQARKHQSETAEETTAHKKRVVERIKKYRQYIQMCESAQDSVERKRKEAERIRNYRKKKSQACIGKKSLQIFDESTVEMHNVEGNDYRCSACNALMFKD